MTACGSNEWNNLFRGRYRKRSTRDLSCVSPMDKGRFYMKLCLFCAFLWLFRCLNARNERTLFPEYVHAPLMPRNGQPWRHSRIRAADSIKLRQSFSSNICSSVPNLRPNLPLGAKRIPRRPASRRSRRRFRRPLSHGRLDHRRFLPAAELNHWNDRFAS